MAAQAVFLLIGTDVYSKEQAIKKISSAFLDAKTRELDSKVFDGVDANPRDILDHISTMPLLASKRLIVIKNFAQLSAEDGARIVSHLKNPPKSACIVLDAEDDSVIKKYPELSRCAVVSRFGELAGPQFHVRTAELLLSMGGGKKISPEASLALKELYGDDIGSVSQELQKLASFVGDRPNIECGDVDEVSGGNITSSVFDLTDAIEIADVAKALSIIAELVLCGKKHYEIVGLLCWQIKRLFKGRILFEKKVPDSRIASELKINRHHYDRFFAQVKAFDLPRIETGMKALLDADMDIKRSRYDPEIALEFAVIKLCLGLR